MNLLNTYKKPSFAEKITEIFRQNLYIAALWSSPVLYFDIDTIKKTVEKDKENKDEKLKLENENGEDVDVRNKEFNLLGVAKHICGCAFDLSLACLFNYHDLNKVKGICMATCCHHISRVEYLNNLDFYLNYLKLPRGLDPR